MTTTSQHTYRTWLILGDKLPVTHHEPYNCIPAGIEGVTGMGAGVTVGAAVGAGVGIGVLVAPESCNPGGVFTLGLPLVEAGVAVGGVNDPA